MRKCSVRARLAVPFLALLLCGIAGTYWADASFASPAPTPCSGWNGHYFSGMKEYNCSFDLTSPVRDKYNNQVGTLAPGTNWVLCQRRGSTIHLGTSYYNYWWAFTVADNNARGWVNAVYGSAGDNYGSFQGVPLCPATTYYTPPIVGQSPPPSPVGSAILNAALSQRGVPYVYGGGNQYGPTNGGFDCSGLVVYAVYQATQKVLYHQAAYQWQHSASEGAVRVAQSDLQLGDIVFFTSGGTPDAPGHVGIYNGLVNGSPTVIDAYNSGYPVGLRYFSQESGGFSGAIRF
jgi:hypothetical protein